MKVIPYLLALGLISASAGEPSWLDQSRIVLSLTEAKQLLALQAETRPAEEAPPIDSAIQSVDFRVSYATRQVTGEIHGQSYRKGWQVIPLFSSNLPLAALEDGGVNLVRQQGMVCALTDRPGAWVIRFTLALPEEDQPVRLRAAAALTSRLAVAGVPEGRRLEFANGIRQFDPQGGEVTFELVEDRPVVPTHWTLVGGGASIKEGNGELIYSVRYSLQGDKGAGQSAQLRLPPGADEVTVTGADVGEFRTLQTADAGRQLQIGWRTPEIHDREIQIAYRIPQNRLDTAWLLELPVLAGSEKVAVPFAALPENPVELLDAQGRVMKSEAPLPRWLRPAAGQRFFAGEMAGLLPLKVRALPQLASETTAIREAAAETKLTTDGSLLGQMTVQVEHDAAVAWQFRLPEGCELLNCEVRGRAANPVIREGNLLELEIPAGERSSTVRLSYTARQAKFDPLRGQIALALPSTPFFIYKLNWKITLPEPYLVDAIDGNLTPQRPGAPPGTLQLEKQLIRGETPQAEIFYVKNNPEK